MSDHVKKFHDQFNIVMNEIALLSSEATRNGGFVDSYTKRDRAFLDVFIEYIGKEANHLLEMKAAMEELIKEEN